MKCLRLLILSLVLFFPYWAFSISSTVRIEAGETQIHSNYFQVPSSGTRVDFPEGQRKITGRVYASWNLDDENSLRLLIAPFSARVSILPSSQIVFRDQIFPSGTPVDIDYKFNSYRLSYIRQWKTESPFRLHAGFTGKIRDAEIKLSSASQSEKTSNVGFVPLLNFGFEYEWNPHWLSYFDLDAAAATQGRALDGVIEIRSMHWQQAQIGLGLRVLDGGVDTDDNENFAQLRTLFASFTTSF